MEWVAVIVVGALGNYLTYHITKRKASGRIEVSEAKQLWIEQERYRQALQKRILELEADLIRRRIEIHELKNDLTKLHFAVAGNVPKDIQDALQKNSEEHIEILHQELESKKDAAARINGK